MRSPSAETLVSLGALFETLAALPPTKRLAVAGTVREGWSLPKIGKVLRDSFGAGGLDATFLRKPVSSREHIELRLDGAYQLQAVAAGGWLLFDEAGTGPHYWIPAVPKVRTLDANGHLLTESALDLAGFDLTRNGLSAHLETVKAGMLDVVIVRIVSDAEHLVESLGELCSLEIQPYFLYASHGMYGKPADLFHHLVHGHVYNGARAWPTQWRIPDELEAYALYLIFSGLECATEKPLYAFLKRLVLLAIMDRQREDGGWYHGEWTDRMECHTRLHVGGMHLLATALEEIDDLKIRDALGKAAAFSATLTDQTEIGTWFLHDSLETSEELMRLGPFPWVRNQVFGKSPTNMLVLNTHLDTLIALDRYRNLTGDCRFDDQIQSGHQAAMQILAHRPLEALYSLLYRLIDLTWRAPTEARRLPFFKRVLKRITWKYLIPRVHHLRARFPRLVMPTGYIERAINLRGVSHNYQTVNLWDLIRYRRRFGESGLDSIIDSALDYTYKSGLTGFWHSLGPKGHALGFWVDALIHLCQTNHRVEYRYWLAKAILASHAAGFGVAPAVLGANTEVVAVSDRVPCPSPTDPRLVVINLSEKNRTELLVVNPTGDRIALEWKPRMIPVLKWTTSEEEHYEVSAQVPPQGWVWAITK